MPERSGAGQRGSVLMLMPAAVLIFVVLGAIGLDFALVFMAERDVANAAAAAANDVATAALDRDELYRSGSLRLDPGAARSVASASVDGAGLRHLRELTTTVAVTPGRPVVRVTVAARVPHLFARAVPGGPQSTAVEASAVATAVEE